MSQSEPLQQKNPNPQGKGLVPLLQDWQAMQPQTRGPEVASEFLRDYAISSLVLTADFRFKPVPDKPYYLYSTPNGWKLSMISPQEWGRHSIGDFLARCQLGRDMTWELAAGDIDKDSSAARAAQGFILGFLQALSEQESIEKELPTYVAQLPYYRRLLATGLAAQLRACLPALGSEVRQLLEQERVSLSLLS